MGEPTLSDVLGELKAIRVLLERESVCEHGSSGVCMACLMPLVDYHLTQMSQTVGNTVWEATRKR